MGDYWLNKDNNVNSAQNGGHRRELTTSIIMQNANE